MSNPRTPVTPSPPPERSAAEQIEALLKLTNRQVANLERAALLSGGELAQLSQLSGILASLVSAQRTASRDSGAGADDLSDAELEAIAARK